MAATLTLLDIAGAIALLLWGVHMVQSGVERAFGANLRRWLGLAIGNRINALLTGLCVTAALQSSTATGLVIASFAATGAVTLVPALAVMLGANIGSTLIVQLLAFDVTHLAPLFLLTGVAAFRLAAGPARDLGRVAIGLGLVLLALARLLEAAGRIEEGPGAKLALEAVASDPIVAAALGTLVTWIAHSSAAVVLIVMSFAAKGATASSVAFALVIGANLGTALNPLLEGARGDAAGRRVAAGNFVTRLVGAAAALPLLTWAGPFLAALEPDPSRAVADFHTALNLAIAVTALPLLDPLARLLQFLIPDRIEPADPAKPLYLDPAAVETPSIALGHAAREALRMADILDEMLSQSADLLRDYDRQFTAAVRRQEDALDRLNGAIKRYLTSLDPESLSEDEQRRLTAILTFTLNLENAGDIIARNVASTASKRAKRALAFSETDRKENEAAIERARTNLRSAASVFMTEDARAARILIDEKAEFRKREAEALKDHLARLQVRAGNAESSALRLDLLRDLERINGYFIAGSAYPVLEAESHRNGE